MTQAFPFLLLPHVWSSRNRARRRQKGDVLRASLFGSVGVAVCGALFAGAYWLTTKLAGYEEFGDYLLRLGLSWLFLTFLAFLAFSGVVTALSTFFLSDDLRLLMGAPVSAGRLFMARFTRTVGQASWMVDLLHGADPAGGWRRQLCAARVLRHGGAGGRAVCRHPGGHRRGVDADARQRAAGAAGARPADADQPAVRGGDRADAAVHPA